MRQHIALVCGCLFALIATPAFAQSKQPILINHQNTDITKLSLADIQHAKQQLHIAYGHTSHGSQLTSGMRGLVAFANAGGKGLKLPADTFAFNRGGTNGSLDLQDGGLGGDCGDYPQWVEATRKYLNNPVNGRCNVMMWSWCGQVNDKYKKHTLQSEYLDPMAQLEKDFPHVTFVYMTGHTDHFSDADNKAANQMIRDFCAKNRKVLFDFADIEQYNPDGKFFEFANDNCDYFTGVRGDKIGNWAQEWQAAHIQGKDWYICDSAHSEPLNANQKAYAAWTMFVEIAKRQ